jgi:small subunit ribosomal protein S1
VRVSSGFRSVSRLAGRVDARLIAFDKNICTLQVSIKAPEIAEKKEAAAQDGSTVPGASRGDILGAALKAKK